MRINTFPEYKGCGVKIGRLEKYSPHTKQTQYSRVYSNTVFSIVHIYRQIDAERGDKQKRRAVFCNENLSAVWSVELNRKIMLAT